MNHPALTKAIIEVSKAATKGNLAVLADIIRMLAKGNVEVWMPMRIGDDYSFDYYAFSYGNEDYIILFSDGTFFNANSEITLVSMGINKVIELVLQNNGPAGIIFNPHTKEAHCIISKDILRAMLKRQM